MKRGTTAAVVAAIVVVVMSMLSSCAAVDEWKENPVRARARAELAGGTTVYAFFAANPGRLNEAARFGEVVDTLKARLAAALPGDGGFAAILPAVNEELKRRLTGDNLVHLPPALLLAQLLVVELDANFDGFKSGTWSDDTAVVKDVINAFLRGAETALETYKSLST